MSESLAKTMRVAMWYNNRDLRVEEIPIPQIGPGELLVRVVASGICGSDVMEWYRLDRAPLVLGHEITGEVVEVGEGVEQYTVGDRVAVAHHVPCNTCHYCLSGNPTVCDTLRRTNFDPGGFTEYVRLPAINVDRGVFILPDEVSLPVPPPVLDALEGDGFAPNHIGHDVGPNRDLVLVRGSADPVLVQDHSVGGCRPVPRIVGEGSPTWSGTHNP